MAAYARDSIGWDPQVYSTPDRHFSLMLTSTLPAGIVSYSLRPEAGWQTRHRLWDPVWVAIQELTAIAFWFLLGLWLDTGRSRLVAPIVSYLGLRLILAALAMLWPAHDWWVPQFLFWIALAGYGGVQLFRGFAGWRRRAATV